MIPKTVLQIIYGKDRVNQFTNTTLTQYELSFRTMITNLSINRVNRIILSLNPLIHLGRVNSVTKVVNSFQHSNTGKHSRSPAIHFGVSSPAIRWRKPKKVATRWRLSLACHPWQVFMFFYIKLKS